MKMSNVDVVLKQMFVCFGYRVGICLLESASRKEVLPKQTALNTHNILLQYFVNTDVIFYSFCRRE